MVAPLIAAGVLAIGSGISGYKQGQSSRKRYRRYRRKTFEQYNKLRSLLKSEYSKIFAAEAAYLPAVLKGYDAALNEAAGLGKSYRRQISQGTQAQQSALQQNLVSSGMSGSTAVQAGLNSIAGSRNDAILSLEDKIRGIKGKLELGKGEARGQAVTRNVMLKQAQTQDTLGLESSYANFLMSLMGGGPQGPSGGLGAGLGQAAGMFGQMAMFQSMFGGGDPSGGDSLGFNAQPYSGTDGPSRYSAQGSFLYSDIGA